MLSGPLVDREVEPVEMCPPERLVLAPVVAAGGGHQGDRRLLGCAVAGGGIAGEAPTASTPAVVVLDGAAARNRLRANGVTPAPKARIISQSRRARVDRQS